MSPNEAMTCSAAGAGSGNLAAAEKTPASCGLDTDMQRDRGMAKTVHFTICSANYLSYARTLAASLRQADPAAEFRVFLADRCPADVLAAIPDIQVISVDELGIATLVDMAFRYDIVEFNTALKPFCFDYVFDKLGAEFALYLDPDIFVLRPLRHVIEAFAKGAECVLIPHIIAPLDAGKNPDTLTILRVGAYNLGFAAFANKAEARNFIAWWRRQLRQNCHIDLDRGIFVDQRYCDLAPSFIDATAILRHPGYNVAYWNLPQRQVRSRNGSYCVNSEPLYFFHFSGVDIDRPHQFSKYQDNYARRDLGELQPLYDDYLDKLATNARSAAGSLAALPYAFRKLENGRPMISPYRWTYEYYCAAMRDAQDPFTLDDDFFNAAASDVPHFPPLHISRLYAAIWKKRRDLQQLFHLNTRMGQKLFLDWARSAFALEYNIPKELLLELPWQANASWATGCKRAELESAEVMGEVLGGALLSRAKMWKNLLRLHFRGQGSVLRYWNRKVATALDARASQIRKE